MLNTGDSGREMTIHEKERRKTWKGEGKVGGDRMIQRNLNIFLKINIYEIPMLDTENKV